MNGGIDSDEVRSFKMYLVQIDVHLMSFTNTNIIGLSLKSTISVNFLEFHSVSKVFRRF